MLMYCDPPAVQKPAIRADKIPLTASESISNENNTIFAFRAMKTVFARPRHTLLGRETLITPGLPYH